MESITSAFAISQSSVSQAAPTSAVPQRLNVTSEPSFQQVLDKVKEQPRIEGTTQSASVRGASIGDVFDTALHRDLLGIRDAAMQGKSLSARELLMYQIKAGELNLRVEMIGKVADSFQGTLKKLQSQP